MLLQCARHRERHLAETTLVRVLTVSTMGLHVPGQLRALRASVRTQLALVRLLTRMRPPVHRQIRAILEYLAAELARVVSPRSFLLEQRAG